LNLKAESFSTTWAKLLHPLGAHEEPLRIDEQSAGRKGLRGFSEMAEIQPPDFTQAQMNVLDKLLKAGFEFTTLEHITRHLVIEKRGFIALLDPAEGKLKLFGQVGYRVGGGIGMLIEQNARLAFVWKKQAVLATPEHLSEYARVKTELAAILEDSSS
jgi:hypothetical protein